MTLVPLATACSLIAFLSGIITIGSGRHYQFTPMDILRGRRNAVLYVWVTLSSIFSLAHLISLLDNGIRFHWQYRNDDIARWMCIHIGVAFLLTSAHLFVKHAQSHIKGPNGADLDYYLWGKHSVQ